MVYFLTTRSITTESQHLVGLVVIHRRLAIYRAQKT